MLLTCISEKGENCFAYLFTTRKIFEIVWREGLWYELVRNNVNDKILTVMRTMDHNVECCVMLEQHMSDAFMCNMGVTQGENLSPLLFAFYVNDIQEQLIGHNCSYFNFNNDLVNAFLELLMLMYEDDTIICVIVNQT